MTLTERRKSLKRIRSVLSQANIYTLPDQKDMARSDYMVAVALWEVTQLANEITRDANASALGRDYLDRILQR